MKRLPPLFILAVLYIQPLYAQEFGPSQQAQGYLDSKGISVDYATGLFHYSVPIYTLKSGDFELPISLDYTAKGVRENDQPGLIDYNWNLNVGGVVTRTVRGGIADEDYLLGYMRNFEKKNNNPAADVANLVNERELDGECDIFTAVFSGQSVHFIIKLVDGKIVADPLERTSVRIECEYKDNQYEYIIDGWIVTDENGNKYFYKQKEYSKNAESTAALVVSALSEHISAWYLTKIEPHNGRTVVYRYRKDVSSGNYNEGETDVSYLESEQYFNALIWYGRPVQYRPFDYDKYKGLIEEYINSYKDCLEWEREMLEREQINLGMIESSTKYDVMRAKSHNDFFNRVIQRIFWQKRPAPKMSIRQIVGPCLHPRI